MAYTTYKSLVRRSDGTYTVGGAYEAMDVSLVNLADRLSYDTQRVFYSQLAKASTFLLVTEDVYFVYVGQTKIALTPKYVEFQVTTVAATVFNSEVGLYSSPLPPNKTAQTLTKIISGVTNAVTALGVNRNTTAFATPISAGTHLWAGIRVDATTPPVCIGLAPDMAQGAVMTKVVGGLLASTASFAATIIAAATATVAPDLRVTLD